MARFFINRPIFAWVLAIIVMAVGTLSVLRLPGNGLNDRSGGVV